MGAEPIGAETSEDVGCRQVGERPERVHPETVKHVDQLWAFEDVDLHRSRKPGDLATRDETGGIGCAGGELGGEGAVGHTDPNVGAFGDDLGEAFVDEIGDGGVAAEIARWPRIASAHVPGRVTSSRGVMSSSAATTGSNSRASRPRHVREGQAWRTDPGRHGAASPGRPPGPSTGRGRHDAVGVHDRHRLGEIDTGGDDGPVGTPGDEGADRRSRGECGYRPAGPRHEDFELTGARRRSSTAALDVEAP